MNCPACVKNLNQITIANVIADVCENGCGGSWLDRLELSKICYSNASISHRVLAVKNKNTHPLNEQKKCPRDQTTLMNRSYIEHQAVVDECPKCAGIWIDDLREFLQAASDYIQRNNLNAIQASDYFSNEFKRS